MPPKKQQGGGKNEQKKKEKVLEDKTFGMKNKKGKKQQQQIQQIKSQVMGNQKNKNKEMEDKKKAQEAKKAQKDELNLLFRPAQQVSAGGDPKSVVCAFFMQGTCQKGAKCKFSHDKSLANKSEKRSLYTDKRDTDEAEDAEKKEGMNSWDQSKLEEVIAKKHGEKNTRQTSEQICKHFLKAVEKSVYGWFWECPNGEKCLYRHALPPGFILKRDVVKEDKKDEMTLEELIDIERKKLGSKTTKVTLETFTAWKANKLKEKKDKLIQINKKKKRDFRSGKLLGFSGREMFAYKPELATADDEEADDVIEREVEEEEEGVEVHELQETVIDLGNEDDEDDEEEEGADEKPGPATPAEPSPPAEPVETVTAIDEDLFVEDELEDLDIGDSDSDD